MKLKIYPTAICRSPLFPYTQPLPFIWESLKMAIRDASPDLYRLIQNTAAEDAQHLPPKILFSCWKYFNRSLYRSTPFGTFGAISPVPIGKGEEHIRISRQQLVHHYVDWTEKDTILADTPSLLARAEQLIRNSSLYCCGRQYRYISMVENHFELSAMERQELLDDLFEYVKKKRRKEAVYHFLATRHQLVPDIVEDLLIQLIDAQLLLTDIHPNIIGQDYFQRLNVKSDETKSYFIAERKHLAGHLNIDLLKSIPETISFLAEHLSPHKNPHLENFKSAFLQKFEYLQVPLMIALDPELGVGYAGLETTKNPDSLLEELKPETNKNQPLTQLPYGPLHQFILNRLIAKDKEIDLSLFKQAPTDNPTKDTTRLPNTFNAIIGVYDKKIILEQAGGTSANALLGRFTLASDEVIQQCAKMKEIEECANPDILFFDIAYQAENRVDNINRRKAIYTYETPILCWTENEEALALQDIFISVQANEIVLHSQKHDKRLIPRLASAYNYTRSDLAVYRFLADIQGQGIQTNLSVKLIDLWPGLEHYPQLSYGHVVLSPRMWKVPKVLISNKHDTHPLKEWLKQQQVSRFFKCGNSDQQLCFDQHKEEDLRYFLQYGHDKTDLYITEALIPKDSVVKDEHGKPFLTQFVISLFHSEILYRTISRQQNTQQTVKKKLQLPGEGWIYFEIYLHPTRTDALLSQYIPLFLKQVQKQIKSWFFIRYNHPSSHIRLRLQVKQAKHVALLIQTLSALLREEIQVGTITDLQVKTYKREIERYGEATIEGVEKYFHSDSRYILSLLKRNYSNEQRYLLSMHFIDQIFRRLNLDLTEQLRFAENIGSHLAKEMEITLSGFRKINARYQLLKKQGPPVLPKYIEKTQQQLVENLTNIFFSTDEERRPNLLMDFIHMHINRLFADDQRMHEMLIYQYLMKQLLAVRK